MEIVNLPDMFQVKIVKLIDGLNSLKAYLENILIVTKILVKITSVN
jgi:hypothetical protein